MRRFLLALAVLILAASEAGAQNTKLAVIINSQPGFALASVEVAYLAHLRMLDQLGIQYDVFTIGPTRSGQYGAANTADSTWFRERYGAVYIPYLRVTNNRVNSWYLAFRDESGNVGVDKSPITGKWSIPVYAANSILGMTPETENPTLTSDSLRLGIYVAGTRTHATAPESLGTWRDRCLHWARGGATADTLYNRPSQMALRSPQGKLGQYVAALAWLDTLTNASGAFPETLMTAWRYRPLPSKPGAVYSLGAATIGTAAATGFARAVSARCAGPLLLLEVMLKESTVKAARKIPLAYTVHHAQSGRTPDATVDAMIGGMLDVHERVGIYSYFAMKVAPSEWGTTGAGGTTAGWERIRAHLRNGWAVWYPHSHDTGYDCNEADSAAFRGLYNAMVNTGASPDSFALPRNRYDVRRFVPANDVCTKQAAATMLRAGIVTMEVVAQANDTGADIFSHPLIAPAKTFLVPGVTSPVGFTRQSVDVGLQGSITTYLDGGGGTVLAMSDRINRSTAIQIETAIIGSNGIFQHYDALWGNTSGSPMTNRFNEWIVEHVVAGYVRNFPSVLEWERPGTAPNMVRQLATGR